MARAFIGIGTNVDREANLRSGIRALRAAFGPVQLSRVFESEPVGFEGDNFYNLVAALDVQIPPEQLSKELRRIEHGHGRPAQVTKFSPRTLDLDLLLYDDLVRHDTELDVPRDDILKYAFVLWPLAELAGSLQHPELGLTYAELWQRYDPNAGGRLWPVDVDIDTQRGAA